MRYITVEDLAIFREEERLNIEAMAAEKRWLKEVEESHKGLIKYEDTEPQFIKYLKAHNEWKEYFDANASILLAQKK